MKIAKFFAPAICKFSSGSLFAPHVRPIYEEEIKRGWDSL